ncbi:MAG: hypothetical protein KC468_09485 [Myxococcales bacterium]|nr:hypothetical protein [Myxococcales bacterium]
MMSRTTIALLLALLALSLGCAHADCKRALDAVDASLGELEALSTGQEETEDPARLHAQVQALGEEFKRQGAALATVELENEDNALSVRSISESMTEHGALLLESAEAAAAMVELAGKRGRQLEELERAGQALERACEEDPHACNLGFAKSMLRSADDEGSALMALKMVREKAEEAAARSEFTEIDEAAAELIRVIDENLERAGATLDVEATMNRVKQRQEELLFELDRAIGGLRAYCE